MPPICESPICDRPLSARSASVKGARFCRPACRVEGFRQRKADEAAARRAELAALLARLRTAAVAMPHIAADVAAAERIVSSGNPL